MTTNNRYLPLFFLCWAFLYSPLAVMSVWPVEGSKPEKVTEEKAQAGQVLKHQVREKPVPDDFTCFCTFYGNKAWGFNCNANFISTFYLTKQTGGGHGDQ